LPSSGKPVILDLHLGCTHAFDRNGTNGCDLAADVEQLGQITAMSNPVEHIVVRPQHGAVRKVLP